ncbi:AraC family transcriptional regulator [Daejeonella lutea]|uniref:AraC-like ligand binding domain-containing protein n=1 Tax=Daejeonella lutea TaxID=572036 RepID=A0A1T5BGV0_9SPHI|nr:helix-turn-helix transcriptional regulator [Daejeonella lutea]SKB46249.1 AraC-like ligand binding domain-containing protein [Daejeonella lutea]
MSKQVPVYDISSVSEFRKEDLLISRFAPYYETHTNLRQAHRHSFYHLVLFTEGKGTHSIDFETFTIQPFQIYFMIPGQVHSWDFEGFVDGYVINFSPEVFNSFLLNPDFIESFNFFRGNASDSVINIPGESRPKIKNLFDEILVESVENKGSEFFMIKILMINIFLLVSRFGPSAEPEIKSSYNYTLLKNFQKLISGNYKILKLPKDYAQLLYITPNHLNALCNDLLGQSAGEVIRNRVFLEAKRLLINPELSISEIAGILNFKDNSYFTKAFKKHLGLTPEEFKKTIKDESINRE